ncbi:MAG: alpha/beta fold hydrolase [Acidimicrobiales bacterium]
MSTVDRNPVILLHGLAGSAKTTWQSNGWLDLLSEGGRTAIAIDLLGHGTAPKPHDTDGYSDFEGYALAQAPQGQLDGIGFSLGARTLLYLAASNPGRFGRLVVSGVGSNLFSTDDSRHRSIAEALAGNASPDDPVAQYFEGLTREPDVDADALLAMLTTLSDGNRLTPEMIASIDIPVLVALGDRDFAGPADPLLEALPQAEFVSLGNTDHFATPKSFDFIDAALGFFDAQPF